MWGALFSALLGTILGSRSSSKDAVTTQKETEPVATTTDDKQESTGITSKGKIDFGDFTKGKPELT